MKHEGQRLARDDRLRVLNVYSTFLTFAYIQLVLVAIALVGAVGAKRISYKRVEVDHFADDKELTIPEEDEDKVNIYIYYSIYRDNKAR